MGDAAAYSARQLSGTASVPDDKGEKMAFRDDFIKMIGHDGGAVRDAMEDKSVQKALASIGILLDDQGVRELHKSGLNARKDTGKGDTLCGRTGIRHPTLVTCKRCLAK